MAAVRPSRAGLDGPLVAAAGAVVIGIVAAVALRPSLGESLWRDEAATASVQDRGLGDALRLLAHEEGGLAAYHLLLGPWTSLVGTSETALRLPSLAAALAALVLTALLGHRLGGTAVGLGAAALLALHPTFLPVYAVEARPPALASSAVVGAALVAHQLSRDGGRRRRWAWSTLASASIALSLMNVLAVAPLLAWVLRRPGARRRPALVAALGLPGAVSVAAVALAARDRDMQSWIRAQPLRVVRELGWVVLGPACTWVAGTAAVGLGVTALVVAGRRGRARPPSPTGAVASALPDRLDVAVLVAWWIGPLLVLAVWTELAVPAFTPRYLLPSAAGGALAASALAGLAVAAARPIGRLGTVLVVALLVAGAVVGIDRARDAGAARRAARTEDLRAAAALVASRAGPGDAVLYAPTWAEAGVRWYLVERPGAPADPPADITAGARSAVAAGSLWTPPTGPVEAWSRLAGAERIWLVGYPADRTWDPVPEVGHPLAARVRACWVHVGTTDLGVLVEEWVRPPGRPSSGTCP